MKSTFHWVRIGLWIPTYGYKFLILNSKKRRTIFFMIIVLSIGIGLLSRSSVIPQSRFITEYIGDIVWAFMVFYIFRFLFPNLKIVYTTILAFSFAYTIELSQLYSARWLNHLRHTTLGGLVLGFGFKASDLVCYIIGIIAGVIVDQILKKYYQ